MSSSLQSNATGEDEALNGDGTSSDWDYLKKPGFQPRPLRLAICGAGAAGLCLAYKILEAQKNNVLGPIEFVLFEKEGDYTGTWHANRYPGCRCDIPSAAYQFSFAPYADWPDFYSYAGEIKKYFKTFAQKHGIVPFIRLRHKVTAAVYDEASGSWAITVEDLDTSQTITETYDVFAPATGVLNNANRPAIAGMESFTRTPILHTAEWPANFNWETTFKDESVAVIGVGSSGLQIIGTIAPYCKSLDIYARSKVWIVPTIVSLDSLKDRDWKGDNFSYSEEERADFAKDPEKLYSHIKEVFDKMNTRFEAKRSNSEMQKMSQNTALEHMRKSLGREDLLLKLIPDYAVGCRRLTPGAAFMEAVKFPHVELVQDPIESITTTSILTESGIERPVDRIILATGFDTGFRPQYTLRGRDGIDLRDVWAQKPKAYMSIALAKFPNMFLMGSGPGIPYANGSILPGMEAQADYVVACLSKMQKQDIKTMEVDRDAQDEYNIQQASTVRDLIWSEHCSSWYKGGTVDGEPYALYAGSTLQYKELLSSPRWEDWKFTPLYKNRFAFLGNGESSVEATGGDRAYYVTLENCANTLSASDFTS
ncbi:cyclohexanone monooxygenase [Armillaria nabsnona]|nr:cyclohexanone monooxygenase [Armillaria nabsnona]